MEAVIYFQGCAYLSLMELSQHSPHGCAGQEGGVGKGRESQSSPGPKALSGSFVESQQMKHLLIHSLISLLHSAQMWLCHTELAHHLLISLQLSAAP